MKLEEMIAAVQKEFGVQIDGAGRASCLAGVADLGIGKGASRVDKARLLLTPKCHVPGENRPLARAFSTWQAPQERLRRGPKLPQGVNQATSIS
jgi:hypothetical protein